MTEMEERLAKYEAELVKLRTENDQLRRSAQAFGELAERLNRALLIATAARHRAGRSELARQRAAGRCRPPGRTS